MSNFLKFRFGSFAILSFVLLLLCSCDGLFPPPGSRPPIHPGNQSIGQQTSSTPSTGEWGVVKCNSQYNPNYFTEEVKKFLSTARDPGQLGPVGCLENQSGGFFIKGRVNFENGGRLNLSALNQPLTISPQSSIEITIEFTHHESIRIPPMPIVAHLSRLNGRTAVLTFEDSKGRVTLDGEIRQNDKGLVTFSAPFVYINHIYLGDPNRAGMKGTIGLFEIQACDLFDCAG